MKIHFIGICGVAMSALAIAFKKQGAQVTGSDAGFFPPVSINLEKHGIEFYPGWHAEKMLANGEPDLIVVGNVASSTNPEWLYARENKLNYKSYPEVIAEYFIQPNSIVCAGTYGKTTTSALLAWILIKAGFDPSYMFGGLTVDEDFDSAMITRSPRYHPERSDSEVKDLSGQKLGREKDSSVATLLQNDNHTGWSILEGDEYKTARWDNRPKFAHYSPTHLLLTGIKWDHADVYPTEETYFKAFEKLVYSIPQNGLIIAHERITDCRLQIADCITYGISDKVDYQYFNVTSNKNGIEFQIKSKTATRLPSGGQVYNLKSTMLGDFMAENICGCFTLASEIGIEPKIIIKAIGEFKGLKRRLEKRGVINDADIYDDIAHSPTKAKNTLATLRKIYTGKIYAVFEPNTGNRQKSTTSGYKKAFIDADEVLIPRLTRIKINRLEDELPFDGQQLAKVIEQTHACVKYFEKDEDLITYLKTKTNANDAVVFLGSHGFRGMIDELASRLGRVSGE